MGGYAPNLAHLLILQMTIPFATCVNFVLQSDNSSCFNRWLMQPCSL